VQSFSRKTKKRLTPTQTSLKHLPKQIKLNRVVPVVQKRKILSQNKQNISKCIVCSPKNGGFNSSLKFPLFSLIGLVWSPEKSSFSGLPEYFQICRDMFQICPSIFKFAAICFRFARITSKRGDSFPSHTHTHTHLLLRLCKKLRSVYNLIEQLIL